VGQLTRSGRPTPKGCSGFGKNELHASCPTQQKREILPKSTDRIKTEVLDLKIVLCQETSLRINRATLGRVLVGGGLLGLPPRKSMLSGKGSSAAAQAGTANADRTVSLPTFNTSAICRSDLPSRLG